MIKHTSFFLLIVAIVTFASCTIETSGNGDLDGFWHLVSIDTASTQGVKDLSKERIFWSFQAHLVDYRDAEYSNKECISHFEQKNDSLYILDAFIYDRTNGDIKIEDVALLQPFGLSNITDTFKILQLNNNDMVIESKRLRLSFKKM